MWWSDYSVNGRRVRKPLSPNEREASQMQRELESANRHRRLGLVPAQVSWMSFKEQYLRVKISEHRPGTIAHDRIAIKRLEEAFHVKYLSEVTPALLEEAKAKWIQRGYGLCAIGNYVMRIKVLMKTAENWGYATPQLWRIVKAHMSPGRIIYYTLEEFNQILAATSGIYKTGTLLMARAGLRLGEVLNLEWSDLDLKAATLQIQPKAFWKPKCWTPRKPHDRLIDLPEDLQGHLQAMGRPHGFVLGQDRPKPTAFSRYYTLLIRNLGLKGSAHAFRHTYASWLISNGCTLEEVGLLLGHTNPATTQMYSHLMPHARKKAVSRLPALVTSL